MKINFALVKKILAIAFGTALALLLLPAPVFSQEISWSLKYDRHTFDPVLVYPNALYTVSPSLANAGLTVQQPGIVTNIDFIKPGAK